MKSVLRVIGLQEYALSTCIHNRFSRPVIALSCYHDDALRCSFVLRSQQVQFYEVAQCDITQHFHKIWIKEGHSMLIWTNCEKWMMKNLRKNMGLLSPNVTVEWLVFLLRIREVPGSKLDLGTVRPVSCLWFSVVATCKCWVVRNP
jgi:hypothetical protein